MSAAGFLAEIRANRRRSVVLIGLTLALLVAVANAVVLLFGAYTDPTNCPGLRYRRCPTTFSFRPGVFAATVAGAAVYVAVAYFASSRAALALNRARPADRSAHAALYNVVEEMAIAAGIPVPAVHIVDDPAPNAFASGRNPAHGAITVTTGLLATMSRTELQGVVAHEIAHIRNRDISVTTVAVLTVGAITVVCDLLLRAAWWGGAVGGGRRRGGRNQGSAALVLFVVALALYLLAVPAALLLRAGLARRREALADASAVELTRYPTGLRSALEKLEMNTAVVATPTHATAHLWLESPLERGQGTLGIFGRLFDTHPPLADRIALLRSYEGLDPSGRGPNDPAPR